MNLTVGASLGNCKVHMSRCKQPFLLLVNKGCVVKTFWLIF